jgi:hypothetical protein
MIDANLLICVIPDQNGAPSGTYAKASAGPYALVLCDQIPAAVEMAVTFAVSKWMAGGALPKVLRK